MNRHLLNLLSRLLAKTLDSPSTIGPVQGLSDCTSSSNDRGMTNINSAHMEFPDEGHPQAKVQPACRTNLLQFRAARWPKQEASKTLNSPTSLPLHFQ